MKIKKVHSDIREMERGRSTLDRRATFMLAVGGLLGLSARSRQAHAEARNVGAPTNSGSQLRNLQTVGPEGQVAGIRQNKDEFEIETADGRKIRFAAVALRFKIDGSDYGPVAGKPVLLPGGMMGDRATLFFASAAEIGELVQN